jgi:DNA-binding NtrC family response regulator
MKPLRVLVLDQDSERRENLASLLRAAGHQVAIEETLPSQAAELAGYDFLLLNPSDPLIELAALALPAAAGSATVPETLDEIERRHVALVLQHTGGNKRKAAQLLGISRSTLLNKVRRHGLQS